MKKHKSDISEIVHLLDAMTPAGSATTQSRSERKAEQIANWIMGCAAITFVILCVFSVWHKFIGGLSEQAKFVALGFGIASMLLPVMSWLVNIVVSLWTILNFRKNQLRRFLVEIDNDNQHVDVLMSKSREELELVQKFIQLKSTRIKNRIGLFFGSPDKVALLSLAGVGWLALKELFSKDATVILSIGGGLAGYGFLQYVMAFFAGIAFGAVLMNFQLQRYVYQLELLDLVISQKAK
ncbi:hypothetical protein [Undibacterium flavidum]|uniref:MotA/TolQ/ExbB proton channel family protein n=1 Tax=Undibacterium flavidum TaxID=2762297 RepID=A0ABR6YA74_9BURK|nr:hypothetical protein [Undibacterium flavidum]MBC3873488.1 hypothetical protein [Undibacterium flavidum]